MVKGGAPQCAIKTHVAAGKTYSCRRHQPRSFDNPRIRGKHGDISRYGLRCNSTTHASVGARYRTGIPKKISPTTHEFVGNIIHLIWLLIMLSDNPRNRGISSEPYHTQYHLIKNSRIRKKTPIDTSGTATITQ